MADAQQLKQHIMLHGTNQTVCDTQLIDVDLHDVLIDGFIIIKVRLFMIALTIHALVHVCLGTANHLEGDTPRDPPS